MRKEAIERCPKTSGRRYLLRHVEGQKLTFKQAVLAKCCECMGGYIDGLNDCRVTACPLYPMMPYRGKSDNVET